MAIDNIVPTEHVDQISAYTGRLRIAHGVPNSKTRAMTDSRAPGEKELEDVAVDHAQNASVPTYNGVWCNDGLADEPNVGASGMGA